jgi:hypothetical protein
VVYTHLEREFVPEMSKVKAFTFINGDYETRKIETPLPVYTVESLMENTTECSFMLPTHHLIKITISVPPTHDKTIRLVIPYVKVMKTFEHYEIINRGGEEFMPSVIVTTLADNFSEQIYFSENVIDRLP